MPPALLCIGYFNWISAHKKFLDCCRLIDVEAKAFSYNWSGNQGEDGCMYWIGLDMDNG